MKNEKFTAKIDMEMPESGYFAHYELFMILPSIPTPYSFKYTNPY